MEDSRSFKEIGLLSGIFLSISASVGSGWLYASYYAAQSAGGAAIYAWIIAGILFLLLGLCFAEVAGVFPQRGLLAAVPSLTHNSTFALPFAISAWLGLAAVTALEATATIEYMVELLPKAHDVFYKNDMLTLKGTLLALGMVMIYTLINFWGAKLLTRVNNIIVVFKLIVPATTGLLLIFTAFHASNFTVVGDTMLSYGTGSIMTTIVTAGLITTFNGLQVITGYASEVKEPKKTIPLVIIISSVVVLVIYLILQIAFIGAIDPSQLKNGWHQLNFEAPMVQLVGAVGLSFMVVILYTDAMVSPLGTAVTDLGAATRSFTAMSRKGQMPEWFDRVDPRVGFSRRSLFFNVFLAMICLLLFQSWDTIAQVLSLLHLLSYMPILLAIMILRNTVPKEEFGFKVPAGLLVAIGLFVIFCYLFCVAKDNIVLDTILALAAFQLVYLFVRSDGKVREFFHLAGLSWLIFSFFIGLYLLNRFNLEQYGFSTIWQVGAVTVYGIISYFILARFHISETILSELAMINEQT